ncbi:hypothetical protein DKP78_17780, partial [Enterococcus faecium]
MKTYTNNYIEKNPLLFNEKNKNASRMSSLMKIHVRYDEVESNHSGSNIKKKESLYTKNIMYNQEEKLLLFNKKGKESVFQITKKP